MYVMIFILWVQMTIKAEIMGRDDYVAEKNSSLLIWMNIVFR